VQLVQVLDLALEVLALGAARRGADDRAAALEVEPLGLLAQPLALVVLERPAIDSCIDSRAPFVFRGSLTTCTMISCPGLSSCAIRCPLPLTRPRRCTSTPGMTMSSTCRKPFLSIPMSTNAASRPGRTLSTLPL